MQPERERKIGVFGGTFNPVHNGHLHLLKAFDRAINFDEILCVVANIPPHKEQSQFVSGVQRLAMLRLALQGMDKFRASDIELGMPGKSYTVLTLEKLKMAYPKDKLFLLMGSDMFLTFHQWYRYKDIFRMAVVCGVARQPQIYEKMRIAAQQYCFEGADARVIFDEIVPLSSTQVRQAATVGQPLSGMVPAQVAAYIQSNGLYSGGREQL